MDYFIETTTLDKLESDCIVTAIFTDQRLSPSATQLDADNQGIIKKMIERGDILGKADEILLINYLPDKPNTRLLIIGLGESPIITTKQYRKALATVINAIKKTKIKSLHCTLTDIAVENVDTAWKTRQIIEIFNDKLYQYQATKSKPDPLLPLQKITISPDLTQPEQSKIGLQQGIAIAQGMELTKFLADLPGNICTPTYLADKAEQLGQENNKISVEILHERELEKLGMGSFLSVSRGSRQPAKLIVLNYQGAVENSQPIVLVGKGLTFDAGGISLKPGAGMDEMKYDMCGGATVLGTLQAAAQMHLPLNIVGIVPASENLPDGDANKPGDIVTSMAGLTIEILNTDAEGRLILCDALTYASKYNPEVVIDMATLTGACLVALGRVPSAILGNDDNLCNDLMSAGDTACDRLWRLPLWEEYQDQLKSNFADIANIGGRDAGTITAACFLSRFTEKYRWAHLDIAGSAWRTGKDKGATGRPVPLLCQYLINRAHG